MSYYKNRNNDMYLCDWYDNYLMKYVEIISKPKYNNDKRRKYTAKLLEWYGNWNGFMEEVTL